MQRGDLETTPLADLLRRLGDTKATGCVYLPSASGGLDGQQARDEAMVVLREGAICGVSLPSGTGAGRSIDAGVNGQQPPELLTEQALADLTELCRRRVGRWRFRRRADAGANFPAPLTIGWVLSTIAERQAQWHDVLEVTADTAAGATSATHPNRDAAPDRDGADSATTGLARGVDGARVVADLAVEDDGRGGGHSLADALARVTAALAAPVAPDEPEARSPAASSAAAAQLLSQLAEEPPAIPTGSKLVGRLPRRQDGLADTAALLRELSSLGNDHADAAPRPPTARAPGSQGGQHARKRKGIFGRG